MTDLKLLLEQQLKLEKKDQRISGMVTAGIGLLLLLFSLLWIAKAGSIPEFGEPYWKTIGFVQADFGNQVEGSAEVNNFHAPSPTPANRPKSNQSSTTTQTTTTSSTPNTESNTKSEQVVQASDTKSDNTSASTQSTTANQSSNNPKGGSNDGNGKQVGNQGHPDAKVLNPDGRFQFGTGIGGPGGRYPLKTDLGSYNVQQEAKITFTIIILPDGSVGYVKAEATPYTDLAQIGKNAIEDWKFNEVDESAGNLKTTVTVKFRLQ